jgi:hypothetical protein
MAKVLTIRPDAKGRITLGKLAKGCSSFRATLDDEGRIILEPFAEIPAREKWLFENKSALTAVREGLDQSAQGKVRSRGSFAQFANDEID